MEKLFKILIALVCAVGVLPIAFGLSAGDNTGANATATDDGKTDCVPDEPDIYFDPTARIWEPNDETYYTAREYGNTTINNHGVLGWVNPKRGNYVFTGETLKYFIIVENNNGEDDIDYVALKINGDYGGLCVQVDPFSDVSSFGLPGGVYGYDTMASFICKLIVNAGLVGTYPVNVEAATGGENGICIGSASNQINIERMNFNPSYSIGVTGIVDFGLVVPGSVAGSKNSIQLQNTGQTILDTYIAASDYFSDPNNPLAICGDGNGIPYYNFSYYAMKGTINSGLNNNDYPGLGETDSENSPIEKICEANEDEYTTLPSHSGRIDDMCRIINWDDDASLLYPGPAGTMSIMFQLDVPEPCVGSFTDGRFYFVGEVV